MTEPIPETEESEPRREEQAASALSPDLWERIKEHKVLQWSLTYFGASLALAHAQDLLSHTYHWPEFVGRLLIGVLIVGFPIVLAVAWYHGHKGLKQISAGELTVISIMILIGAGLLIVLVRPPAETAQDSTAAPVRTPALAQSTLTHPTSAPSESGPSIAVLPFVNMSSDREQEYFSDGLSEELLNELAHVPNLRVIGRTSSFAFKGKNEDLRTIGETLGVEFILEGSVRKSADSLRITAQLINPANGSHLWSQTYDRMLGDVFAIQEDIARTVASALRVSVEATNLSEGGTHSLEAYDLFLRAWSPDVSDISDLERAVELDPQFTQAWVLLANAYSVARFTAPERSAEWLEKGRLAENHVFALAPQSAAAKTLMGEREIVAGNLLQGERLLVSARTLPGTTLESNTRYGAFLLSVGRPQDAFAIIKVSQEADPIAVSPRVFLLMAYEMLGEFTQEEQEYRRAIAVLPNNQYVKTMLISRAMALRDPVALRREYEGPLSVADDFTNINRAMVALLDNAPAALAQLRRWNKDADGPFQIALQANWAAYFGDPELSLQLLRRMPRDNVDARLDLMTELWRPMEKSVRSLPGFKDFVRELGLPDYWRTGGNWGDFCRPLGQSDFECK
jgi:TolB-like protein/tetratricopeptide (TPR) repeat protein